MYYGKISNLSRRLGEIDEHCTVVGVVSFSVVPDVVAIQSICVLINQNVSTDTYTMKQTGVAPTTLPKRYTEGSAFVVVVFVPETLCLRKLRQRLGLMLGDHTACGRSVRSVNSHL